jgi:two-component system sensor histidine kinase UhpB
MKESAIASFSPDAVPTWLALLSQLTGRGGGIDYIVSYTIGAMLWTALLMIARGKLQRDPQRREYLLVWGFGFCLARDLFMILMGVFKAYGVANPLLLHEVFPPLDHTLLDLGMILIAAAYLQYLLQRETWTRRYLTAGVAATLLCYAVTFWWWAAYILANPQSKFGQVWCDWLFHGNASFWMALAAILIGVHTRGWVRNVTVTAFGLFFLEQFLKLPDMAMNESYEFIFAPIRHGMHLAAIPLFGYVYLREMENDRQQQQQALRASEERFDLAVKGTNDGIWDWDLRTGQVYVSDQANALLGYAPQEVQWDYTTWASFLHPDERDQVLAQNRQHFEAHQPQDLEYRLRTKTGEYRWFRAKGLATWDATGRAVRFAGSIRDVTNRRMANQALRESNAKLRDLSEHVQKAREDERSRIARELHDQMGSTLAAASLHLGRALNVRGADSMPATDPVLLAHKLVESAELSTRKITTELRPSVLDFFGLWAALDGLAEESARSGTLSIELSITDAARDLRLPDDMASAIFRIVQEALTNVVRHAHASVVHIDVALADATLVLKVSDDGVGIDPGRTQKPGSWGLIGMQERARALGGELNLANAAQGGAALTAKFPCNREALAPAAIAARV